MNVTTIFEDNVIFVFPNLPNYDRPYSVAH